MEGNRATVPEGAKQAGEIRDRWSWVEPCVWTDRMLTALEEGVKGGKWFSLIDKVYRVANLQAAFREVKANGGCAGMDHQTVEKFEEALERNVERLSDALREGTYSPQAVQRVWIPKPGSRERRPLGIPTVRDRVVQAALRHVLEPIFERDFAEHSYGFRPGRGCKDALRQVVQRLDAGYTYVVDADLKNYFDTIPHDRLMERVRERIADRRVLRLVEGFLQQRVMEPLRSWTPEGGTPQGAGISPLLANLYLAPLDHLLEEKGLQMIRYADDFIILCRSQAEAERALDGVGEWTTANGLTLHPKKTRIVDATQRGGFDFLGYHFERGYRWPRQESLRRLKATLRAKTKRTNGRSLETIIQDVNRTLRGWFAYFKHSYPTTFPNLDGWVRMRLRSILRKRRGGRGRGRGSDHQRWPNAFFAERGLFSFTTARAAAGQSSRR
jgi:RNA-directed DNA polymerase